MVSATGSWRALAALAACAGWTGLFAAACGDAPPEPPADPVRAGCLKLARTWCESKALCLSATFASEYGNDEEECVLRQALLCERTRFGPGSTLTAEGLHGCAERVEANLSAKDVNGRCETWLRWEVTRSAPGECLTKGLLPDGSLCFRGNQCQTGDCVPSAAPCGTCKQAAALGEPCFEDADCERGRACGASGECVAYNSLGALCGADTPCLPDATCGSTFQCQSRAGEGELCDAARDGCELWPEQLACNPSTTRCERYAFASEDEECGELTDGPVALCTRGLVCEVTTATRRGVCVPATADRYGCLQQPQALPKRYPFGGPCQAPATCSSLGRCGIADAAMCDWMQLP